MVKRLEQEELVRALDGSILARRNGSRAAGRSCCSQAEVYTNKLKSG